MSIRSLLQTITSPSTRFALGTLVVVGAILGLAAYFTFETVMHETSTDEFCVSCHELEQTVGDEYVGTSHHSNSVGVQVTCADCHLPKEFVPKMWRKMRAANELYHHLLGTIATKEQFEAHRMRMATWTWAEMNESDSRECRHCHEEARWNLEKQSEKARQYHDGPLAKGKTCIDCHKGLAHKLPEGIEEDAQLEGIDF